MPNAKDYTKTNEKIMAVGTTGGGKTSGFLTMPGKKFIYIFDPNALSTLRGHDIDYELFTPDILPMDAIALKAGVRDSYGRPPEPKTYVDFENHFENAIRDNFFADYDAIGFDGMTTFSDIVMDRILYINGRPGKWPEQADWTACMNTTINVLRTLTSIETANIYVTAHIEFKQEEASQKMLNILTLIGRLRQRLPLLFSEIWRFYADQDNKGKTRFYVQTQSDRYNPFLRTTMRGLETNEDVTIEDWHNPENYGISALMKKANQGE